MGVVQILWVLNRGRIARARVTLMDSRSMRISVYRAFGSQVWLVLNGLRSSGKCLISKSFDEILVLGNFPPVRT